VSNAQRLEVSTPNASTAAAQPAITHQAARLAETNPAGSEPASPELSTEPATAMPSVAPTWRLVDATAAATPAWLRGRPATALFVIGAFTIPNPTP
jgi:hypothetical protein